MYIPWWDLFKKNMNITEKLFFHSWLVVVLSNFKKCIYTIEIIMTETTHTYPSDLGLITCTQTDKTMFESLLLVTIVTVICLVQPVCV